MTKFDSTGNLVFSTFLGGNDSESGSAIAVDTLGDSFVTGSTSSPNFPIRNAYNSTYGGNGDVFVTKFNSSGSFNFSTFLGGSDYDQGTSIAIDTLGNIYVAGVTYSSDFPTTHAFQSTFGDGLEDDVVVTKFSTASFSSTNPQLPLISPLISSLFSSNLIYLAFLMGIIVICIVTLFEYRKYYKFKVQFPNTPHSSFYKFLVCKFSRQRQKSSVYIHLYDRTFEILSEIEQENTPKD